MNYFSQWPDMTLMKPGGGRVKASEALSKPAYLVIYIAASWVPESSIVTPLVIDFFRRQHVAKDFAVLYISRDTSEEAVVQNFESHTKVASPPPPSSTAPSPSTRRRSSHKGGSSSSSAKHSLTEVKEATDNFLTTTAGYYGLPFEWVEKVALPLVHQLRVFTYPSVLVFDNRIAIPPPLSATEQAATSLRAKVADPTTSSPRIERDACTPRVLSITGRFMLEVLDPNGDNFPWTTLDDAMAMGRRLFLSVALVVSAMVVVLIAYMWPTFATAGTDGRKRQQAQRRLAHEVQT